MVSPTLVWFRDDLRLHDHPALHVALERGGPVIALFVLDEESPGVRPLGGAAKWWLRHSLASLAASLEEIGGYFGGRDHTTVLHGVRQIDRSMKVDRDVASQVSQIDSLLVG